MQLATTFFADLLSCGVFFLFLSIFFSIYICRSIVRATAAKDVALVKEILDDKLRCSATPLTRPSNLFPNYPSQEENLSQELDYSLLIAVSTGCHEIVELLLAAGANVSHYNKWYPMVCNAANNGNVELLQILLKHGSDPDASLPDGSGLHAAARLVKPQSLQVADTLLKSGANIDLANDNNGSTPLHEAVKVNHLKMVDFLLNSGAKYDIPEKVSGRTALHFAASNGRLDIVEKLISKGANPVVVDSNSCAPWMLAMQNKYDETAKVLCSYHDIAGSDSNGRSPLHIACSAGCVQSIQLLLGKGAQINALDNAGNTPLMEAVKQRKTDAVSLLLNNPSCDVHTRNNSGESAIHLAVERFSQVCPAGDMEANKKTLHCPISIINMLLRRGASINTLFKDGSSMLTRYVRQPVVFDWLLNAGANANIIADDGNNVLMQSVMWDIDNNTEEHTEKLLKANIDIEKVSRAKHNGCTAVEKAAKSGSWALPLVRLLVNSGSDYSHLVCNINSNSHDGGGYSENITQWLKKFPRETATLQDISRAAVLRQLGHIHVSEKIKELFLPRTLQQYLIHDVYLSWRNDMDVN